VNKNPSSQSVNLVQEGRLLQPRDAIVQYPIRIVAGCAVHHRKQWRNANAPGDEKIFGRQFESKVVARLTDGEQVADAEPSMKEL
jgi:hypothetical protein